MDEYYWFLWTDRLSYLNGMKYYMDNIRIHGYNTCDLGSNKPRNT